MSELLKIPDIDEIEFPKKSNNSPVREYKTIIDENGNPYMNRIMIGTAVTGLVRIEWVSARYGQMTPMNWSFLYMNQFINSYMPLRYQVADAQNLIVKHAIDMQMEWLLLIEHDVIIPPDTFMRFNEYMIKSDTPVVSGLYFCRGRPSYPLLFRGRGNSIYTGWEKGDKVWVDGVPTGVLLIHMGIMRTMWEDCEEYEVGGHVVRRVFDSPRSIWVDPENSDNIGIFGGTSDLDWCNRVIKEEYFAKSGWDEYQEKEFPFLVDTNIFCSHINPDGQQFP